MQRWELGVPAAPEPVSKLRSSPAPTADPDGADEDAAPIGGDVVDLTAERLRRRVDPPPQPA